MTPEQGEVIIRLLRSINIMLGASAGLIAGMGIGIIARLP